MFILRNPMEQDHSIYSCICFWILFYVVSRYLGGGALDLGFRVSDGSSRTGLLL